MRVFYQYFVVICRPTLLVLLFVSAGVTCSVDAVVLDRSSVGKHRTLHHYSSPASARSAHEKAAPASPNFVAHMGFLPNITEYSFANAKSYIIFTDLPKDINFSVF